MNWTDANLEYLRNTMPIATLNGPGLGKVDGTAMMSDADEGYVFLFNPNLRVHNASLSVDESLGLSNASSSTKWTVTEIYPRENTVVGTWTHGDLLSVAVVGSDARVLHLTKASEVDTELAALPSAADLSLPEVYHSMPINAATLPPLTNTGGSYTTKFTIPAAVHTQLAARAKAYPIEWTAKDKLATWLDPNRLLGNHTKQSPPQLDFQGCF